MYVRELADTLDPMLAVELYATQNGKAPEHLGLFRLDTPELRSTLLEEHGEKEVKGYDVYKAYALVYV